MTNDDSSVVYTATYSNVPVYESILEGVSIMRRQNDSWINITQILKALGFDKPHRTRILEKEIQNGVHEKIQGGYGKYQGTWIPLTSAVSLCQKLGLYDRVQSLLEFKPDANKVIPTAPKHALVQTRRAPNNNNNAQKDSNRQISLENDKSSKHPLQYNKNISNNSHTFRPHENAANGHSKRTSNPTHHHNGYPVDRKDFHVSSTQSNKQKGSTIVADVQSTTSLDTYSEDLLSFFMNPTANPPEYLINPPPDFNVDAFLDDEQHTSLHWASAMGHIHVIQLLIRAGANTKAINNTGQTPLMRSVMFTNNYDLKSFPTLVSIFRGTVDMQDHLGQNVFHHIAHTTNASKKADAALYYFESLANDLSPTELEAYINTPDREGNTPLIVCAMNCAWNSVKFLLQHRANPDCLNDDGQSAAYFISQHGYNTLALSNIQRNKKIANGNTEMSDSQIMLNDTHRIHAVLETVRDTSNSVMADFEEFAKNYKSEMQECESDYNQASELLQSTNKEIEATKNDLRKLKAGVKLEIKMDASDEQTSAIISKLNTDIANSTKLFNYLKLELKESLEELQRLQLTQLIKSEEQNLKAEAQENNMEVDVTEEGLIGLSAELRQLQSDGKHCIEQIVSLAGFAGTGERMDEYRKLLALGCGIKMEELDGLVIEAIDEELRTETFQ